MKKFSILLATVFAVMTLTTSCNDEWTEEQYEHYISFKAPLDDKGGVSSIYVPATRRNADGTPKFGEAISNYQLPMIVSGTTRNDANFTVKVGHDTDTLAILNYDRFQQRKDLHYKDMSAMASYPETVNFTAGSDISLLDIRFDFHNIDMVEKWVLPIMVKDDATSTHLSHPRKHYGKALLRVFPYNAYSGNYSATTLLMATSTTKNGLDKADGTGLETARAYFVSDDEVFFYAGDIDESRVDRRNYKIKAKFTPTTAGGSTGTVTFSSTNPKMHLEAKQATYTVYDRMDDVQQWLKHHYIIINDINYTFCDYTVRGEDYYNEQIASGVDDDKIFKNWYKCTGTLTLERRINTQIPDEDQAIEW